ncbi:abcG1 [Symbiodinium natans]|uniref:AbcG1 protein n=1 Tax=Symbiodinium natans TaxID=878477 RepID=A0A812IDI3_9DINO|nr:abcG1 [Symbiodinium natans]
MLDEPTSGLDATTALDIMRSLKKLSEIGMTVVMVVHQPRYSLFTLFDEVLLLGLGGKTVYLGNSKGVLPYFTSLSYRMPEHENPADWFMDVISGKVKNEGNPNLKSDGLAEIWAQRFTEIVVESAEDNQVRTVDLFTFTKALDARLASAGVDSDRITDEQFLKLLEVSAVKEPSPDALRELKDRIGFEGNSVSRDKLSSFLCGLSGSFSSDALSATANVQKDMAISEASASTAPISEEKMSGKRARFCAQFPVLLHQNVIRWMRLWKHKAFSLALMSLAAMVFGTQCKDKLTPENVLCPIKINISHVAIGLLMGVACLPIFGSDRMVFWRESASGVRVSAFFLSRATVFLFDVLVWTYVFTAVWKVSSQAPCGYWLWLVALRMTAVSAAGIGVLISTLIPKSSSTLATAVVLLIMGGAISEPQVVAEAKGSFNEVLAFLSPFTWTSGENYLAVIAEMGGEDYVNIFALDMMDGYRNVLLSINLGGQNLDYLTSAYISCSVFGFLGLTFGYLGLRFSHRGKQA